MEHTAHGCLIKGVHHGTCGQQILDDAVVPRGSSSVKRGHSQQINSINIGSKLFNKQLASTDLKVGRGRPVQRRLTKLVTSVDSDVELLNALFDLMHVRVHGCNMQLHGLVLELDPDGLALLPLSGHHNGANGISPFT